MAEFAAAFNTIVGLASSIQQLGESYYKASAEYEEFSQRLTRLQRKGSAWVKAFTDYGISDNDLVKTMNEAISVLEKEVKKLSNKENGGSIFACVTRCCAKAHVVAFPSEIQLRIKAVEDAIDAIPELSGWKQQARDVAEQNLYKRPHSLRFSNDERYVPLKDTERKIYFGLEKSCGRIVVLLYGGPGTGKSSLARNVALHYEKEVIKKEELQGTTRCALFEQVVFLECGPQAETSAQQQRLLQQLGLSKISSVEDDQQGASDFFQLLKGALKSRKILIIFDDVCDDLFLQEMIDVCGDNVKCLVTSQKGDLCSGLSCPSIHKKIQIQEICQEVGRKILASYVGFPHQQIPNRQILDIVDRMIEDTIGNPLALASVVSAIQENKRDSLAIWEEAYSDLQDSLKANNRPHLFGQKYPRSFWAATKLSIQSLRKEAQSLLILTHLCKGPSVPEEVIRFLLARADLLGEGVTFRTLANELEGRELVKINDTLTSDSNHSEKSWSTHSLQKVFMDEDKEMQDQKGRIFELLLGFASTMDVNPTVKFEISKESLQEGDAVVTRVLCTLYFEDQFAEKAASQLSIVNDSSKVQQRQAFEPITRLLGKPPNLRWTATAQTAAKQVFVEYFCKNKLDDKNTSLLLKMTTSPSAQFATLAAIADIHLIKGTPLLIEDSTVVTGLVTCLQNSKTPILQEKAAYALWALGKLGESNKLKISSEEGALAALVTGLVNDHDPSLQEVTAKTLACLSYNVEDSAKLKILSHEGVLGGLVSSLAKDANLGLQKWAASALWNLSNAPESCKDRILKEEGGLEGLLHCLCSHDNPDLQEKAAGALKTLAYGGECVKLKILSHEGILAGLVSSLAKDANPGLQKQAAWALRNLSYAPQALQDRILKEEGTLEGLLHSLCSEENPDLQEQASAALNHLAWGGESAKLKILSHEGILVGLVSSLAKDASPGLQKEAASALLNLSNAPESLQDRILKEEGALAGLVHCLSSHDNPRLQKNATGALANLASGRESAKLQVLNQEGSLMELVRCLSKDDSPTLVFEAARALRSLANGPQSSKLKILKEEGALAGLVKSASKHENPALQKQARAALENLVAGGEGIRLQLVDENRELAVLVNSVFEEYKCDGQEKAMATL